MKKTPVFSTLPPSPGLRSTRTRVRFPATAAFLSVISLACLAQDIESRAAPEIQKIVTGMSGNRARTIALSNTVAATLYQVSLATVPTDGTTIISGAVNHAINEGALLSVSKASNKDVQPSPNAGEVVAAATPGSRVPEPTTWGLLIVGLGVVILRIERSVQPNASNT